MEQLNMFQVLLDDYKINKPVRLIELFAGYGSQALALKYLGVKFSHWRICEWAVKSIQAYKDIHFSEDNNDYSQLSTKEQLIDYLTKKGISSNYNEPMTYEQIKRLNEKQLRTIYNNIIATKNLVNISQVKAKDLDICDTENYNYIMTYSFPCQDLSLAGLQKGMEKGSSTRSGLLWEVERILDECHKLGNMPQILLMENVPQVVGSKNINDFKKWLAKLESLGYSNYCETINAKDYLIPQNRERTFMISILGDYNFNFPKSEKLELRLKNLLEENVDEKYYLSTSTIERISNWKAQQDPLKDIDKEKIISQLCDKLIAENKVQENDVIRHSYSNSRISGEMKDIQQNNISPTLDTRCDCLGVVVKKNTPNYIEWEEKGKLDIDCRAWKEETVAPTATTTPKTKVLLNNLRIRKLTPKEWFRLMGVKDEDYENVAKNQSNASLYHLAGDSIVTTCLMAIFSQLFDNLDWKGEWQYD